VKEFADENVHNRLSPILGRNFSVV
jgi:hypothetical protein